MSFLSFFKYVLFIYNFIVMLFGGTLLGLATYFYVDTFEVSPKIWPIYSTFFILIIGIGLLTFIVGFFGCCGACKESSCMLCLYFTIIIAFCALIGTMVFLPEKFELKPQQIKMDLQHDIQEIIQRSYTRYNTTSFANMLVDKLQEEYQCCGSNNYTDWQYSLLNNATRPDFGVGNSAISYIVANPTPRQMGLQSQQQTYYNNNNNMQQAHIVTSSYRVPVSCCARQNSYEQCKQEIAKYDTNPYDQQMLRIPGINRDGCVDRIYNSLFVVNWVALNIIGGLAIGLQGLSLIFSFCLCCAINRAIDDDDDDEEEK